MRIFISGSLAYDRIMDFPGRFADHILPDKIHVLNVSFMVNGLKEKFGGTAGNIAYSLSLLGEKPLILAAAGKDFDRYGHWLADHGLPLSGVRTIDDEFTGGAYITTDLADNQITGFNPGAMKHSSLFKFDGVDPKDSLAIAAPGNVDDMLGYPAQCRERGIPYIFDPGQQIPVLTGEQMSQAIAGAFILTSNDYELDLICQATGLTRADILARGTAVITTMGDKGALVCQNGGQVHIPAAKAAQVKDPTGAGDAFRAGLLKGLAQGRDLADSARMGAVCASFAVECYGTQEHVFTPAEFKSRWEANFG